MSYRLRVFMLTALLALAMGKAAAQDSYGQAVGRKLGVGFANIVLSWVEIPKSMINGYNNSAYESGVPGFAYGLTGGLVQGVVNTTGRVFTGVLDVVTFPLPTKPIPGPAFVWEDFRGDTHYGQAFVFYNEDYE